MSAPEAYIRWINEHLGFNPRSQRASDALAGFVLRDLLATCKPFSAGFQSHVLLARTNAAVRTEVAERDVDLVAYEADTDPIRVRLSVENKTIMAAHGKARKNRYGDIIAYSNHVHNHRRDCVAGAVLVINTSAEYQNPDGFAKNLKRPKLKMEKIVTDTVGIFAGIPLREDPAQSNELPEALAVILVDYDGMNPARLVTTLPAPQPGDKLHYENFLRLLCEAYRKRSGGRQTKVRG